MTRSRFDRSSSHKTTFNVGDLIPIYVDEVLPGDTFSVTTSKVVRLQTLMTPIMDDIYLDTYFFFVPNRIVWNHWRELMGENTQSAWIPTVEYSVPQISSPEGGWNAGTIADYMGIPIGVSNLSVNALPFRAYALICNEWFRDENLTDPLNIPNTDATVVGVNSGSYVTDVAKGGLPFKVAKYHDYFNSALPSPQKGPEVTLPVGLVGDLPVQSKVDSIPVAGNAPLRFQDVSGVPVVNNGAIGITNQGSLVRTNQPAPPASSGSLNPTNLWAIPFADSLSSVSINQLRTAFQIQKMYERDARGGTRYIEILKSHFGVTSPDARLQRPEYLGGTRCLININTVVQSSQTAETPQGNLTAYGMVADANHDFSKSFVEHGFIIGVMAARYRHSYQQGLERFWSRQSRFDYYWPVFANLGEMAILNKEIFAQGTAEDDKVFGYQEAWADYRYKPSRVSGEMRSQYAQSLDSWHLADYYKSLPHLSDSWIREDKTPINRVIAVSDQVSNQLFCDIHFKCLCTRPLPLYSIPGLVDHH